jgi:hypothetical protein
MWTNAEADARRRDRMQEAEQQRMAAAQGRTGTGTRRALAGHGRRLRQAAGFGLVRTGLRLLDTGRA